MMRNGIFYVLGGVLFATINLSVMAQPTNIDSYLNKQFTALYGYGSSTLALKLSRPVKPARQLTVLITMARQHWTELSSDTQALVQPWLYRPTDNANASESKWRYNGPEATPVPTDHFLIHYVEATNDPANASKPSWVSTVATVLEDVWNKEHGQNPGELGYGAVPSDIASTTNGGDGKYDVYLTELGSYGLYGYVAPEGFSSDASRPYGAYSYMVLDNDYVEFGYPDPQDPLKVTVAHEYFHAIQFGYSYEEDSAFMEQSSTWMEDVVYPTIHDNYNYIGEPYLDTNDNGQYDTGETFTDHNGNGKRDIGSVEWPEYSLDAFDTVPLIQYGRFLWVRYLEKSFGTVIEREIWERCGAVKGDNTFEAENTALTNHGSSLAQAYQEYAEWGYDRDKFQTGDNYPPLVYVDRVVSGSNLAISSSDSPGLTRLTQKGLASQLHLSTVYTYITNPTGSYKFTTTPDQSALTMLVDTGQGNLTTERVVISNDGTGIWSSSGNGNEQRVIAVISNVSDGKDNLAWSLTSINETTNPIPVISVNKQYKVKPGDPLTFVVTASDPDGTTPILKASSLPPGSVFDTTAGLFSWSSVGPAGIYKAIFTAIDATDNTLQVSNEVAISVNTLPKITTEGDKTVKVGDTVSFTVTVIDDDGTTPLLQAVDLPSGASFDNNSGVFEWKNAGPAGNYKITFTAVDAIDNAVQVSTEVSIIVNALPNTPPKITTEGDKTVKIGDTLSFNVTAIDVDGTMPSLQAVDLPNGAIFDNNSGLFEWKNVGPAGTYQIQFNAIDAVDNTLTDKSTVTITVEKKKSGGCALVADSDFDPLLLVLLLGAITYLTLDKNRFFKQNKSVGSL